jgi:hypothetical protein
MFHQAQYVFKVVFHVIGSIERRINKTKPGSAWLVAIAAMLQVKLFTFNVILFELD